MKPEPPRQHWRVPVLSNNSALSSLSRLIPVIPYRPKSWPLNNSFVYADLQSALSFAAHVTHIYLFSQQVNINYLLSDLIMVRIACVNFTKFILDLSDLTVILRS